MSKMQLRGSHTEVVALMHITILESRIDRDSAWRSMHPRRSARLSRVTRKGARLSVVGDFSA